MKWTADPQQHSVFEMVPYKQNGWIGTTFIPYERKYKGVKETKIWLCGLCYAWAQMELMKDAGEDVTELELELIKIAENAKATVLEPPQKTRTSKPKSTSKVARKRTTRKSQRPAMSATEATTFEQYSGGNMTLVDSHFSECGCQAYADTFTYRRWLAQGQQVEKGQKGCKITVYAQTADTDDDGNETSGRKVLTSSTIFCKHQVKPVEEKVAA